MKWMILDISLKTPIFCPRFQWPSQIKTALFISSYETRIYNSYTPESSVLVSILVPF